MFQVWFKEVSGCVRSISRVLKESFNRVFQKWFMVFSSRFQGNFKKFSYFILRLYKCFSVFISLFQQFIRCSKKILRGPIELKNAPKSGKVHNFLDPPSPRMIWTFLNLGKIWNLTTPPPLVPNLEKIWNW